MSVFTDVREIADQYGMDRSEVVEGLRSEDLRCMPYADATDLAAEYIADSLWAFRPGFVVAYCDGHVPEQAIAKLQELHEDANDAIRAMVGDNLEDLVSDAIGCDGLGHFLNSYDGDCLELSSGLVAWRT